MDLKSALKKVIKTYDSVVLVMDSDAKNTTDRAYGGVVRAAKGKLQEYLTESLVKITWESIGGKSDRLEINSSKISIPIKPGYIKSIRDQKVRSYIKKHITDYFYKLSVDKHVFIDGEFVIGIECKAYAENAMIKRILVDFDLLKTQHPSISCYLFQLESQLGGDYQLLQKPVYGSKPTHTIQSYFSCDLNIITFLEGERDVDLPIHKHFKPLKIESLYNVVDILSNDMKRFV